MKHPSIKSTLEVATNCDIKDTGNSTDVNLLFTNEFSNHINVIKECINTQINNLHYKCYNSTYINRLCMYNAYYNLLENLHQIWCHILFF